MKFLVPGVLCLFCVPSFAADGENLSSPWMDLFGEYAKLERVNRDADDEPAGGLGLTFNIRANHNLRGEIEWGPHFYNGNNTNTFFGWRLDFATLRFLYQRTLQGGKNYVFGGVGYARLKEWILFRDDAHAMETGSVYRSENLTHHGLDLSLGLGHRFLRRLDFYLRVSQYVGSLENLNPRGQRTIADGDPPLTLAAGFRWRFYFSR